MAVLSQAAFAASNALLNRPTFTQVVNGFDKFGGVTVAEAPTILRVVSDYGSITPMWDRQTNLTNFSHYVVQVSGDFNNWYSLGFSGQWYDTIDEQTIVYDNNIKHTQVPHNDDGSSRTLYYRVATITKADVQSDWSIPVSGSTVWIEQDDIRNNGNYSYLGLGSVIASGEADVETDIPFNIEYIGSGTVQASGSASTDLDKNYVGSGTVQASGSASTDIDKNYIGSGTVQASGEASIVYEPAATVTFGTPETIDTQIVTYNSINKIDTTTFLSARHSIWGDANVCDVTGTSITAGTQSQFVAGNAYYAQSTMLTPTKAVFVWYDNVGTRIETRVADISGTTFTYGSEQVMTYDNATHISIERLSDTKVIFTYKNSTDLDLNVRIGTINGTIITFGNEYILDTNGEFSRSTRLSDTTFLTTYMGTYTNDIYAKVSVVTGASSISSGTAVTLLYGATSATSFSIPLYISSSKVVVVHIGASGSLKARTLDISGNVITMNTEHSIETSGANFYMNGADYQNGNLIIALQYGFTSNKYYKCTVDGDDITVDLTGEFYTSTVGAEYTSVKFIDTDKFVIGFNDRLVDNYITVIGTL